MGTLNVANLNTTGNLNFDGAWADAPTGTAIQYVVATHTVMTVRFVTSSTSFEDSGYSITITPRNTSSKILIYANISGYSPSNNYGYMRIYNSTAGRYVNAEGGVTNDGMYESAMGGASQWAQTPLEAVDMPNSTSAQTYKIYTKTYTGQYWMGWSQTAPNTMNYNFMSATEFAG